MSRRRRTPVERDQAVSTFSATLMRLCESTGALGATLVDQSGEAVDYAGYLSPYLLKVMAAEWRIILDAVRTSSALTFPDVHEFIVRSQKKSFALIALAEGYALVLELPRGAFAFSHRAVVEAVRELELEAGLPESVASARGERWSKLDVRTSPHNRHRPEAVWLEGAWHPIQILGRYADPRRRRPNPAGGGAARSVARSADARAVGYRARLPTGQEFALVREPMGIWFSDDLAGFEQIPR